MKTDGLFRVSAFDIPCKFKEPVSIVIFGDVHRDSPNHAHGAWQEFLAYAKGLKHAVFLGMGDFVDSGSTSERECLNRASLHESTTRDLSTLAEQKVALLAKELSFMKGRLIGLINGNHFFQFCLDDGVQALTRDGWRHHHELKVGEEIMAYKNGELEWQPIKRINVFDTNDVGWRCGEVLATRTHKWLGKTRTEYDFKDWTLGDSAPQLLIIPRGGIGLGAAGDPVEDCIVELVAWLLTDGSIIDRKNRPSKFVRIFQSTTANPVYCQEIERALNATGHKWHSYIDPLGMKRYALSTGIANHIFEALGENKVPKMEWLRRLTTEQVNLFFDVCVKGDGGSAGSLAQKCKDRLEPIARILNERGFGTSYCTTNGMWFLRRRKSDTLSFEPKSEHISGKTWCPTVEAGYWLARSKEGTTFVTGNSDSTNTDIRLCQALGCTYLGVSAFVRLSFVITPSGKRASLDLWAHHGTGAGRLLGGSINRVDQMREHAEADIYIMGHDHRRMVAPATPRLYLADRTRTGMRVRERQQWLVRSGSFLASYEDGVRNYNVDAGRGPCSLGHVELEVTLTRKQEDGAETTSVGIRGIA